MSRPAWLFVVLLSAPISPACGQQPPAEEPAPPTAARPANSAIGEASEVTLAPGQTVGDAVRSLAERHNIRIEFTNPELADRPLQRLQNEVLLRGVPLMMTLNYAVSEAGLAWDVRDDAIMIGERQAIAAPPADKIRAAMLQETRLEFPNTPLRDALNFLADMHDINVIIDEQALSAAAVDVDDAIDIVLSGISLGDALNILLEPYDLTYVTTNDVLLVTTTDRAAREVDTRSYDVSAVVGENGYATEAAEVLTQLLEPRSALAGALIAAEGKPPVPLPQPRVVPFKQKLLVTASLADQRRVEEILRLMEETGR